MLSYALQAKVKNDPQYINQIEEKYFRNSGSQSPEVIFKSLGIDITHKEIREQ
jgi:oligoendopeptidase F